MPELPDLHMWESPKGEKWRITGGYDDPDSPNYKGIPSIDTAITERIFSKLLRRMNIRPVKIFYNHPVMVVLWEDGGRTKTTCSEEDHFDPEVGFAVCLAKHMYTKKERSKFLRKVYLQMAGIPEAENGANIQEV